MTNSFAVAQQALFQAPHGDFVAERKRLAGELRAAGDKAGAAALLKVGRPALSVWVVNQLWWTQRAAFERLLDAARRVKAGELAATAVHREALEGLRGKAAEVLTGAGHAAAEATLRRVGTTLAALAASGGFAPDAHGCLQEDRDPPGFEAMAGLPLPAQRPSTPLGTGSEGGGEGPPEPPAAPAPKTPEPPKAEEDEEARLRREEEALAQRQREIAEARAALEKRKALQAEIESAQREVERLRGELIAAEKRLAELTARR